MTAAHTIKRSRPEARCPLRPDDICSLSQLDVTGPQDCGLVYLVMSDPEQREEWGERRHAARRGPAFAHPDRVLG